MPVSSYSDYYKRMGYDDPPVLLLTTADKIQAWRRNASVPREKPADEIAREHRRKMEAEHAETMRGAKVGTWLFGALFVVVIYAAAQIAGFAP